MDILTAIRAMTPETLNGVRSDFDDDAPYVAPKSKVKEMVRIVEGATDLHRPNITTNDGKSVSADWSAEQPGGFHDADHPCNDTRCCPRSGHGDARSPRQVELMASLHMQLADLDPSAAEAAVEYTTRMTLADKWTPGRDGNASDWIGRMIKKVRELKAAKPIAPATVTIAGDDIPDGYYAIADCGPNDINFFRISSWQGRRYVKIQASGELHPIRNPERINAVFSAIRTVGIKDAMGAYGIHIGRCGRCRRVLTDDLSRARGIGPDCWGKM